MKIQVLTAALAVAPLLSSAADESGSYASQRNIYDAAAMCELPPKVFFSAMFAGDILVQKAVAIKDGVSIFRPHLMRPFSVNNMRVKFAMGYVRDQLAFPVIGTPPAHEFYGFIVKENISEVESAFRAIGSPALIRYAAKGETSIICKGD